LTFHYKQSIVSRLITYGKHFERQTSSIDVRKEIDSEVSVSKDTNSNEEKRKSGANLSIVKYRESSYARHKYKAASSRVFHGNDEILLLTVSQPFLFSSFSSYSGPKDAEYMVA